VQLSSYLQQEQLTVAFRHSHDSSNLTINPPNNTIKMSNTQVGNVYSQIIADVIESSRVDFEEGGVDEHVLDELRRVRLYFPFLPSIHRCVTSPSLHVIRFSYAFCNIFESLSAFLDGNG
jgi:transcription initiation factor TFIIA large subunit